MSTIPPIYSSPVVPGAAALGAADQRLLPAAEVNRDKAEQRSAAAVDPADATAKSIKAAAEQIESYLRHVNTDLEFRVDEAAGKVVVSVRERATGELIRQIPSKEALALAAQLDACCTSGLVDKKS
ncbi:MAG: flagellar protein FlaG [Steroidobacteraceae bacterium]